MAHRFISATLFLLAATMANAQAFGRFGYSQVVNVPGLQIDKEGFIANDPLAEKIRFAQPSAIWKPIVTTDTAQIVHFSADPGCPTKASFSLLGIGFSLFFEKGIDLRIRSKGAPFLTWKDGSVAENVATPEVRWLVLSFRDKQPPVVIGFPNGVASLIVSGKPGDWSVRTPGSFRGWVRIALPSGLNAKLANTAGTLGRLAKEAAANEKLWTTMAPRLLKTSIAEDLYAVTATWQFDSEGAIVPAAAELASLGGYPLEIKSKTTRLPGGTETGPVDFVSGDSLTIRFPVRRIPTGRCLTISKQFAVPVKPAPAKDVAAIANLALSSLVSERDPLTRKAAEDTISDYVSQTEYSMEPWTHQQLPFASNGTGIDLAAAQALLMQALTITSKATSESNSLLTSVSWRRDWLTWRVWVPDDVVSIRTGALAAIAGAFCPEPERRLSAGMFQAGISAYRGLNIWRRRQDQIAQSPKVIEPLYPIRKAIFGIVGPPVQGESFVTRLLSPLRVFSDGAVLFQKDGSDYEIAFNAAKPKPSVLMLASAYPIEAYAKTNLASLSMVAALGFSEIHYASKAVGNCEVTIKIPPYGAIPPIGSDIPPYIETAF